MQKLFKFVVMVIAVVALAGAYGVFSVAHANRLTSNSPAVAAGTSAKLPVATGVETLKSTKFLSGSPASSLPTATFVLIDSASVSCPGTSGTCLLGAEENGQIEASATSNWAICTQTDGSFMNGCPYLGPAVGGDFVANSFAEQTGPIGGFTHVAFGTHTMATYYYMRDNPGTAEIYNFAYRVYKP